MQRRGEDCWAAQAAHGRHPAGRWRAALLGVLLAALLAGCTSSSSSSSTPAPLTALPAPADLTFNKGSGFFAITGSAGGAGGAAADGGMAVAVDSAGRILVAGFSNDANGHRALALWRLGDAGTLDISFGNAGVASGTGAACAGCSAPQDTGRALALDASGNILVAGTSLDSSGRPHMVLWRFTSSGSLDNTFGTGGAGYVTQAGTAGATGSLQGDVANGVAVTASGTIVVAGSSKDASGRQNLALWRFTAGGSLDASFGSGGTGAVTQIGGAGASGAMAADVGNAVTLDASGNILVAGSSRDAQGGQDLAVWRFTSAGSLDTTFAGKGYLTMTSSAGGTGALAADVGSALAVGSTGAIAVAGSSRDALGSTHLAVWRFTSAGTLDSGFNGTGYALVLGTAGGTYDAGTGVAIDSQGRVLVAGFSQNASLLSLFAFWRFTSTGTLDTQFDVASIEAGDFDRANGLAVDLAGRALVTGQSLNSSQQPYMVLARLNNL